MNKTFLAILEEIVPSSMMAIISTKFFWCQLDFFQRFAFCIQELCHFTLEPVRDLLASPPKDHSCFKEVRSDFRRCQLVGIIVRQPKLCNVAARRSFGNSGNSARISQSTHLRFQTREDLVLGSNGNPPAPSLTRKEWCSC